MRRAAAALLLLITAACGGDDGTRPVDDVAHSYGAGIDTSSTAATPSAPPAPPNSSTPPASVVPAAPRGAALPANVSVRDDPSGFRLQLVVGDNVRFPASATVPLRLEYENTSEAIRVIDTNQEVSFVIAGRDDAAERWTNLDCRASVGRLDEDRPRTPGYGVAPGGHGQLAATYPVDERPGQSDWRPDPNSCRLPPGRYTVVGVLQWCPDDPGAAEGPHRDHRCAPESIARIESAPVHIELV